MLLLSAAAPSPPEELAAYRRATELCDRGDWKAANPFITSALRRFAGSDSDSVWGLRLLLSQTFLGSGQMPEAESVLAVSLPVRLATSEIAVRWMMNTAVAAYRQQKYDEADLIFDRAEALARRSQPRLICNVLLYRANQKLSQKHTERGLWYARAAVAEARKVANRRAELKSLATVAVLLTQQERYAEAIKVEKEVVVSARSLGDDSTVQKTEGNLGWAYTAIGEYDVAYEIFTRVLAQSLKLGAELDSIVWMNQVADAARRGGNYPAALSMYRQGVAAARKSKHPDLGEFLTNMGVAQLETGNLVGARASVSEALSVSIGNEKQTLAAMLLDARLDAANGLLNDAINKCRRVIARKPSKPLRWEAQGRLAQMYVAAKQPAEAEEEFRNAIDTAAEARKAIEKEELRLPFGALVREVYDAYVDFLVSNRTPEEALVAAERSRAQTLEDALQGGEGHRRIDPRHIAHDRGVVVLDYWLARQRSFVWIVTGTSIDVVVLPPSPMINRQVDDYMRQIFNLGSEVERKKLGANLFATLVGAAAPHINGVSRIIVVPDGRLHVFNMETLVVPNTSHYWIEDVTIDVAASLELLGRVQPSLVPASSILIVGDPSSPDPEFPRLKNGASEIRHVASHFSAPTILEGANATPAAYMRAGADHFSIIDFVAHGVANRSVPLDSAVVLARDADDFKLYARDIIRQPLHARLVTISSCDGAGTRAYTGEGLVGLAWAFLHAGAQQVIAALWEVDEAAAPQLMDTLYTGMQKGLDPAAALRAAKLQLVHAHNLHRQPYYWAPFVLYSGS